MKRLLKNKRILMIIGLLVLFAFECTFAYFHASDSIDNEFQCSEAKIYMNEKFNPNDKWVPGEEKQKEVRFGNEGKIDALLRVKFEPVLEKSDGTIDAEAAKGFSLNFSQSMSKDWVKLGEWYYYKKVLIPGEMTDVTLKSVTVSSIIGNDEHGISPDYSSAKYKVNIASELVQASQAADATAYMKWDLRPQINGNIVTWN